MVEKSEDGKGMIRAGRFNVVDLLIVLFVITVVLLLVLIWNPFSFELFASDGADVTLSYTVCLSGVDATYVNKIMEGDPIFDANTKQPLGRVSAVESSREHAVFRYDEETGGSMEPIPNSYDIFITVLADGVFEETVGYSVEEKRIAVGAEYMLLFPNFAGKGYCVSIREIE